MDVKELITKAAVEEENSYKFYMAAIDLTEDAAAKLWLKELAEEEIKHKEMLQNFNTSRSQSLNPVRYRTFTLRNSWLTRMLRT